MCSRKCQFLAVTSILINVCGAVFNPCGLVPLYKTNNEEVRTNVRMCTALAHLPLEDVDDGCIHIIEIAPSGMRELEKFHDYFVEQWLDMDNVKKKM